MMIKKLLVIFMLVAIVPVFSGCSGNKGDWKEDVQYLVHFGLNDKDTGEQIVSKEEARQKIQDICVKKGVGFTVYDSYGAYVENDVPQENETLVFSLVLVTEDLVNEIADEAMESLNLASVFIVRDSVDYVIYGAGEVPSVALNK